jgi:hypothetical protein
LTGEETRVDATQFLNFSNYFEESTELIIYRPKENKWKSKSAKKGKHIYGDKEWGQINEDKYNI